MSTTEIDSLSAEIAQEMCVIHPDNSVLATRILVSNIQKNILEILVKCWLSNEEISYVKSSSTGEVLVGI